LIVSASTLPSAEAAGVVDVRIFEDAHPVEFGSSDKIVEFLEIRFGFAGEADDEAGAQRDAGMVVRIRSRVQESVAVGTALHARQHVALACCSGISMYFARRSCAQGSRAFFGLRVRIGVEKTDPQQVFHLRQALEELREAIAQAESSP